MGPELVPLMGSPEGNEVPGYNRKFPKLKAIKVFPTASTWPYQKQVKGSFRNVYDALAVGDPGIKDIVLLTISLSFYEAPGTIPTSGALCLEEKVGEANPVRLGSWNWM